MPFDVTGEDGTRFTVIQSLGVRGNNPFHLPLPCLPSVSLSLWLYVLFLLKRRTWFSITWYCRASSNLHSLSSNNGSFPKKSLSIDYAKRPTKKHKQRHLSFLVNCGSVPDQLYLFDGMLLSLDVAVSSHGVLLVLFRPRCVSLCVQKHLCLDGGVTKYMCILKSRRSES